ELLQESPRYAALRSQVDQARAEVTGAGVLPNPRVSYGRYDLISKTNTMYDGRAQENYTLEVPVQIAGQRGARVETAQRGVARSEAGVQAEFQGMARDLWSLFVKLLVAQEQVVVLQESADDLARLHRIVQGRQQGGSASSYDVLRIGVETGNLQNRLAAAQADVDGASGALAVALGFKDWRPRAEGQLAPLGVAIDPGRLQDTAQQANPTLETARRGEVQADAALEQARRERWPTPSLFVGSAFTDRPYGNATYAGVSVELPIFDRGQGGMARAEAARRPAALERETVSARTRAEVEVAADQVRQRRAVLESFERQVLQPLPELKDMAENAYRLGKGSLLELLDAARSRTEIRINHLNLLQAEIEAELDLLKAVGGLGGSAGASGQ
ncbi:MAG: TolC family protein, partial [Methylococcaceae bacterium]|nr:TolC family protein [Methylococcaceae bacterium]